MRNANLLFLALVALLAGCSTGGSSTSPMSEAPNSPAAPGAATRIDVKLLDTLRMEPGTMTVPAGVPVTFVVTNSGSTVHEFYLGDETVQGAHEMEMMAGPMAHDDPEGITVEPGETRELTYTFGEAGESIAGCHVAGHYDGGMRAGITVAG
ncbi:MAG: copper-binding protein [Candidatus Limnocylindrales bacterium]